METINSNFNIDKQTLLRFSVGGIIYYYLKLPSLRKKNPDACYNINSPFRNDSNPSMLIKRNPSNNTWSFYDFGDASIKGDVFDFAARCYNLSVKTDFKEIIQRMYFDLKIDSFDKDEVYKLLNGEPSNISYSSIIGRRTSLSYSSAPASAESKNYQVVLQEKKLEELSEIEMGFLNKTGINWDTLVQYNSCFLMGYSIITESYTKKEYKKPIDQIWIGYKFSGGAKIYCPYPKKFWYVGKPPKNYLYGTPNLYPEFEELTSVYLVAGEKDCLALLSKGVPAMCLSSETKSVNRSDSKSWYFDSRYRVIVIYDIDSTGIEQAMKLHREAGLKYILLPEWVKEKGGKDITDFFTLGGTIEEFNRIVEEQLNKENIESTEVAAVPAVSSEHRLCIRTAAQRIYDARLQPDIKPHFDVYFQKGELAILFGDTGKGKSIAAVTLSDAITKGQFCMGLENAYGPLTTLYYDFELSDKQFQKRYSNESGEVYIFNDNFYIDNLEFAELIPKDRTQRFENLLIDRIRKDIKEVKAEVVVIDNITFLTTHSAEDSQVALSLMRLLKELKTETGISILVLAHTPKKTNPFGITIQDLAGSKHIPNFADSVFALGYSNNDSGLRYFIQVKPSRSGELKFDKENVLVCEIEKINNFLTLVPKGFAKEYDLIKNDSTESEESLKEAAFKLKENNKTVRQISEELKVSKSKVGRWLIEK